MTTRVLRILVLLPLLNGASATHAIELLFPDSHVSTIHPRISVVGRTGSDIIMLDLNGKPNQAIVVKDSTFHLRLPIPYGLNHISLRLPADSSLDEAPVELQVLCGPKISRSYEKVFGSSIFHGRIARTACLDCHESTGRTASEGDTGQWCYSCHADIRQRFSTHGVDEDEEGICTNCHRIEADLTRNTAGIYSDMNPCYLCHTDKIGEFAQDFIHGPVAGGSCTVCHNPHGSQFDNNLRSPLPVLCLFCHVNVGGMQEKVIHKPFAEGRCTACHDPHATGNRWVLVRKTGELCTDCHEDDITPQNHRHPIGGDKPKNELVKGLAVDEHGHLECLTCHLPHGSAAGFLLRSSSSNGCRECHPEY